MADQQQVNQEDPEVIRRRMEETRASLAEKIEVLEQKVTNTVEEATSAVSETVHEAKEAVHETVETVKETVASTVEKVKGTVSATVESVKEAFDLSAHVRNHPWTMFGGSVAVGFLGGMLMGPSQRRQPAPHEPVGTEFAPQFAAEPEYEASSGWTGAAAEPHREQHSWWHWLNSTFGSEIEKLKGLAVGTMGGVVRDLVGQALPEHLKPMVTDLINNVTSKLGGETIHGRIVPEPSSDEESSSREHASYSS
jgi:ElaB/YqjD/DUF883 family membrane-anchored ribosome-binding protein